jgi:DNA-binding transcriptional MerR regulator
MLRISQLAERSGVPATTLRFYDSAGLLPAERTPAGYRVYDERSVERLEFISSAKLMGLPLEEIAELLKVWEQGVCASVRQRLLPQVAQRMTEADQRIAELSAFSAHLARVRAELITPAPEGACGPGCGCIRSAKDAGPVTIELLTTRPAPDPGEPWRSAPVAGTLSGADQPERIADWHRLTATALTREATPDGIRLSFAPDPATAADAARLAAAETLCCPFLDFTVRLSPAALVLTVRAPEAAASLVTDLFGAAT